jgi:hypothetical protein
MTYYCILYVRTNLAKPSKEMLLPKRIQRIKITDRDSAEEKARAVRRQVDTLKVYQPFRYFWLLSSDGKVSGSNVSEHIQRILSNFKPTFRLAELKLYGAEYGLSFYWGGGVGTGHGPIVTPELAALLIKHEVTLDIGIY